MQGICRPSPICFSCWGDDKSLALIERAQSQNMSGDARDFYNIETRGVIKFFSLQGKAPKEIHAILTEILTCFLPGRAKDLSAPLYISPQSTHCIITPPITFPLYDKATHTMAYNFTETFTIFCLLLSTQHIN